MTSAGAGAGAGLLTGAALRACGAGLLTGAALRAGAERRFFALAAFAAVRFFGALRLFAALRFLAVVRVFLTARFAVLRFDAALTERFPERLDTDRFFAVFFADCFAFPPFLDRDAATRFFGFFLAIYGAPWRKCLAIV